MASPTPRIRAMIASTGTKIAASFSVGSLRKFRAKNVNPPSVARIASTINGIVMTGGDSRPSLALSLRGLPKKTMTSMYHIESGQERGEQCHGENRQVVFVGDCENRILTEKSAERRTADQCQRARA